MEKIYDRDHDNGRTVFKRLYFDEQQHFHHPRDLEHSSASEWWVEKNPVGTRRVWCGRGLRGHSHSYGYYKNIVVEDIPGEEILKKITYEHHLLHTVVSKITPYKKKFLHPQEYDVEVTFEWGMEIETMHSTDIQVVQDIDYNPITIKG